MATSWLRELVDPDDTLDSAWRICASHRLTMLLLAGLALLVVLGGALPQRPAEARLDPDLNALWLASLRAPYGSLANWLVRSQLADVYHSFWLRGLLGLLALNLVLVAIDWVHPRVRLPSGALLETEIAPSSRVDSGTSNSQLARAVSYLHTQGYRTWRSALGPVAYAQRSASFPVLVCLGLLLALGGLALSERTAWWENLVSLRPGQARPLGHGTGLSARADTISGNANSGRVELTFLRSDEPVGKAALVSGTPALCSGLIFYLASTHPVLAAQAQDSSGQSLPLRIPELGTQATEVTLAFAETDQPRYIVVLSLGPGGQTGRQFEETGNEKYILVPSRNLSLRLSYVGIAAGSGEPVFELDAFRGSETEPFYRYQFRSKESLEIAGDQYVFSPQRHAVIRFGQDYAAMLVIAGLLIVLVGIPLSLRSPPRRVWLSERSDSQTARLRLATPSGGIAEPAGWFADLTEHLREALDHNATEASGES